ncbi:conjugal transfer protein TraC [Candidatus Campbellbacteria bacterium]|nr:MAG: conjugal transfer protein TraC [Candidatus Campbellbacteria bacterium]
MEVTQILPQEIYKSAVLDLKDIIAPSALDIKSKYLDLGDILSRTFFIISYPKFLSDGWFSQVINLDKEFDISIFINPLESERALKNLQKKIAEVQSQIMDRERKGLVRDPALDAAYLNIEKLRDKLQQSTEKLYSIGIYITVYGENEKELDKVETEIKSILESKLIYVRPAVFQQAEGFKTTLPLNKDLLNVTSKLNSEPLASIFPFVSFNLTSDNGILYGVNRHNSSLILFDRFSLPNYNSVTFATSGAGKSYTTKLEILRTLMFDTDVIIIDPEREYEYLAEAVDGRYFNISLSSSHHINPFDLPPVGPEDDPQSILRNQIVSLVGFFRIIFGGMSPEEDAMVDRALTETYALKDITPEVDFSDIEPPLLSDFEMVLSGTEGSSTLVSKLSKYIRGSWAGFLNKPSNVDMDKKVTVFSIRDMEEDLRPVAMYLITHHIWNSVRRNLKKRLLVIDEAWTMMKSEDAAFFLFGMAKRGRKYYLGLSTITQDVGDFLGSEYGVPIITNSSMQILLKQSPTTIDRLQEVFNLTEEEKMLLLDANVGEGIFFAGTKHAAIKVIASYTEDQIITSDPSQILALRKKGIQ